MARYIPEGQEVVIPSVRQSTTVATANTSVTRSFSSTPLTGSLLLFVLFARDTTTLAAPAGFTLINLQSATLQTYAVWYKFRASGETNSYTFTSTVNTGLTLIGFEVLNASTTTPIAFCATNSEQSPSVMSATCSDGTVTLLPNTLLFAMAALSNFTTSWTYSTGNSSQVPSAGSSTRASATYFQNVSKQYNQTVSISWPINVRVLAKLIAINPVELEVQASIAGSDGGATFQRSGKVFSIRKRNVPLNPKSPAQTKSKNRFGAINSQWRNLDNTQKTTFNDEAPAYPRTNSLGVVYEMSGQNLQSSSNQNAVVNELPVITSMPSPVAIPAFTIDTIALDVSSLAMDIVTNPETIPSGFTLRIMVTRPMSPGNAGTANDFVVIGSVAEGINTNSVNWFIQYTALFGETVSKVGQQINVRAQLISNDTLQAGDIVSGSGFVEP